MRLQYRRYRLPFRVPVRTAHGLWREREGLVLRIEEEGGAVGYGEVAPIPHFGTETVDEAEETVKALGEWTNAESVATVPARLGCLRNALAEAWPGGPHDTAAMRDYLGVAALLPPGALVSSPAFSAAA